MWIKNFHFGGSGVERSLFSNVPIERERVGQKSKSRASTIWSQIWWAAAVFLFFSSHEESLSTDETKLLQRKGN